MPLKLAIMFNTEIRKHIEETSCHGFLIIDTANSSSRGLGSKQKQVCSINVSKMACQS